MSQVLGELGQSVGYALKQATTALHSAMDAELRPQGLTVSQYACLEQLSRSPEQSTSELARSAFVTRQSMNEVLRGLEARDLVTRPDVAAHGRARPTRLTAEGARALVAASTAVAGVERRMLAPLSPADRTTMLGYLAACRDALAD